MELNKELTTFFREKILFWHLEINERHHPWSEDKDPYKIWLSEIIMQQTRIEQGLPYYLKFIEKYPTIFDLAAAQNEEVFLLWQGLGYYNRCKNLLETARFIVHNFQGKFPKKYDEIRNLKGIGPYTAAAIASFAYDLPHAVLDGNVFRLLSRFWAIDLPIDNNEGKFFFSDTAQKLLPKKQSSVYNQAIMDFGATVCTPVNPHCSVCPLAPQCKALSQNLVALLPVKEKKIKIKERYFQYFLLKFGEKIYLHQRLEKDIWQNLFELFLIETKDDFEKSTEWKMIQPLVRKVEKSIFQTRQRLTHQLIQSQFHFVELENIPCLLEKSIWVNTKEIQNFAFPKTILQFLQKI